jgi:hypothetical protein
MKMYEGITLAKRNLGEAVGRRDWESAGSYAHALKLMGEGRMTLLKKRDRNVLFYHYRIDIDGDSLDCINLRIRENYWHRGWEYHCTVTPSLAVTLSKEWSVTPHKESRRIMKWDEHFTVMDWVNAWLYSGYSGGTNSCGECFAYKVGW